MDVVELLPGRLHLLRFPIGQAYLWHDPGELTLIDTGVPGSGPALASAIRQAGYQPGELRRLLLTHFHADHIGSAAEVASWSGVEVCAHHADAPFIRGGGAGPGPDLADWERPLYQPLIGTAHDQYRYPRPPGPAVPPPIDRELHDGDPLGFGDGATVVAAPGHTPGSIAVYLPRHRVLFTGDAVARSAGGQVSCGVFNVDRGMAAASVARLAELDAELACFGHGEPAVGDAAAELRRAAQRR
jgi:glyoxylase-like metal-dependent hydrolase (beta-lactamase superfamily II)